jgi:hypothetical protein
MFSFIDAMKKRDQRLQQDPEYFEHTWKLVKESIRQLKHDHKRNLTWQKLRAAQIVNWPSSQSPVTGANIESNVISSQNDENNISNMQNYL